MGDLKNVILEESIIKLTDGTVIQGSEAIAREFYYCCNAAVKGFSQTLVKAGVAGIVVGASTYGVYKLIKHINKKDKNISEEE